MTKNEVIDLIVRCVEKSGIVTRSDGNLYYTMSPELFSKALEAEREKEEPWRPAMQEKYFFLDSYGKKDYSYWDDDAIDHTRLAFGNIFRTEQELEAAMERVRETLKRI